MDRSGPHTALPNGWSGRLAVLPNPREDEEAGRLEESRCRFCEFFAGDGNLTSAMARAGVATREPDDLASGGVDFQQKSEVDLIRAELLSLLASGVSLMVHFAPPMRDILARSQQIVCHQTSLS